MQIIKYVCDGCGRELNTVFRLIPNFIDKNGKLQPADKLFPDQEKNDYCSACVYKALEHLNWDDEKSKQQKKEQPGYITVKLPGNFPGSTRT